MGEQHCGERPDRKGWAGPLAKQECAATRGNGRRPGGELGSRAKLAVGRRGQEPEWPDPSKNSPAIGERLRGWVDPDSRRVSNIVVNI
jgi:hypothetical protein